MSKEKGKTYNGIFINIQHVKQPSSSTHTTVRSGRISLKLWPNNFNWNSCKEQKWQVSTESAINTTSREDPTPTTILPRSENRFSPKKLGQQF